MKFNDYKYERPDMSAYAVDMGEKIERFKNAESFSELKEVIKEINVERDKINSMMSIVGIRSSIDTRDEFYQKERLFFDENGPLIAKIDMDYYTAMNNSAFKDEITSEYGEFILDKAKLAVTTISEEVLPLMMTENKLISEYRKLRASAKIEFDGKINNLPQMTPYLMSKDRETRKEALIKTTAFFEENEAEFDRIYDELVKVRTDIAKKLGYENFVQLGYDKLGRTDYTKMDVKNYREQVYKSLVGLSTELKERQAKRIGVDTLMIYDDNFNFKTGNPTPKGEEKWLVDRAATLYKELSPETDEFFTFMRERELMDLTSKEGKAGGGFCDYLPHFKSPFIYSNFNGTSGDVDVLTHEAGHAFQVYMSRNQPISEYYWPTFEAAEIHSMSMEHFAYKWIDLFFEEDTAKYKFNHLNGSINFVPYGVTVDEFQHFVYENPDASPDVRKAKWREIEKKYLPHRNYDGIDLLERGGFWYRQGHIFEMPFYYIDYTLAIMCALQFWHKSNVDMKSAFSDYLELCKRGGSLPFKELVKSANLIVPFEDGAIEKIIAPVKEYLDNVDDFNL